MSLSTEGVDQLKLQLRRLAFVPQIANDELYLCAKDLAEKARDMAPIDFGDLRKAIMIRRTGAQGVGGRFVSGVSNYEVLINNSHPVSDPEKIKHGVATVGEYAWYVHEYMGWASQPNPQFMPSAESVAAGLEHGVEAGGKFIERAGVDMVKSINSRLAKVIFKYTDSLAM